MLKKIILLALLFSLRSAHAQEVAEFWIYDTSKVVCGLDRFSYLPDTIAYLKEAIRSQVKDKKVILYWDKNKKNVYTVVDTGEIIARVTYYRNGHIDEETYYHPDSCKPHESWLWRSWHPDGKKKGECIYEGKKRSTIYYFRNGLVCWKDVSILGGDPKRPDDYKYVYTENYCENGQLTRQDSIGSHVIHTSIFYYCNGTKRIKFNHNVANDFGKYYEWHENGTLSTDGQYDEIVPPDMIAYFGASKKQGRWKYYNEKGELIKEEVYKDGVVISTKEYKKQ
jgi:antitoxin component YwqK of YwqJK toxin-antitoxin module